MPSKLQACRYLLSLLMISRSHYGTPVTTPCAGLGSPARVRGCQEAHLMDCFLLTARVLGQLLLCVIMMLVPLNMDSPKAMLAHAPAQPICPWVCSLHPAPLELRHALGPITGPCPALPWAHCTRSVPKALCSLVASVCRG